MRNHCQNCYFRILKIFNQILNYSIHQILLLRKFFQMRSMKC